MGILYILIGLVAGAIIGWFVAKSKNISVFQNEKEIAQQKYNTLENEFVAYKATSIAQLQTAKENAEEKQKDINSLKTNLQENASAFQNSNNQLSTVSANLQASNQTVIDKNKEIESLKEELKNNKVELNQIHQQLATAKANNEALNEKFVTQKKEIEELGKKFNTEFENIANKILDTKTEKFTELNKSNLKIILEPLGKNIDEFKKQVDEVYKTESKERFSLGEKVKELATLNQQISEEAKNLTRALKGEAKTQGRWGEMILESILEKSGLRKGEEYFMEHQLLDAEGKPLKSDSEGKKMRPDAVIKYPDNRSVIIDSKVSLNAFTRFLASDDAAVQKSELEAHVGAVKNHILTLSSRGYDDYDKSLDFVMMFIPSEPAYMAALQGDHNMWSFAYEKRILLINPTNLIISLKLIVDLWKREYQNKNAQDIAERGAKLYDKFVGFVENLDKVGKHIDNAKDAFVESYKQLSTGKDNLVTQATKLKSMGLKTKNDLSKALVDSSNIHELSE